MQTQSDIDYSQVFLTKAMPIYLRVRMMCNLLWINYENIQTIICLCKQINEIHIQNYKANETMISEKQQ